MENNIKRKLNVVFANNRVDQAVVKFLSGMYDLTVVKNYTKNHRDKIAIPDLIIFTGGEDVSPELYGDKKGSFTNSNSARDVEEKLAFDLHRSYAPKIAKLGICRGAQFLTVMNGGKLVQHVEGHTNNSHTIQLDKGGIIKIAGDHHQMMYPFDLNKKSYELIGYSERHLSTVYLNGNNKNIDIPFPFFEPEIVYYPHTNSFCVQAHPEWEVGSRDSDAVLKMVDKFLFNRKPMEDPIYDPFNDGNDFEEDFEIHEDQQFIPPSNNDLGINEKPLKKNPVKKTPYELAVEKAKEKLAQEHFVDLSMGKTSYHKWMDSTIESHDLDFLTVTPANTGKIESFETSKGVDLNDVIEQLTQNEEENG